MSWERAWNALKAHSEGDRVVQLILYLLDESLADQLDDACDYGRAIGPDVSRGADEWTDEEYEALTGKRRSA